ncbi:hypothetical protein CW740_09230 [Kangiella profundi]|uniref:Uncharacterized protein n=1 Tax=Kangiella profundi TaxID=1561924 RepID=A0A2K9AWB4_9GAMM|nr:hypothetical protein [Kangiella profundi]AUD79411.1 hypothetical protein CW740_09230 [Kangiella profundi]GGE98720.1 hypothetical protein GCM10011356_10660 [Kangiella profundi]
MKKLLSLILLIALLISGCATLDTDSADAKPNTKVFIDQDNTLNYVGSINEDANLHLFNFYNQSKVKPTKLKISSPGGNVMEGLRLGNWVFDNKLDVIVDKVCASSCANYVFPAGKIKYLNKHSALIWHGNSHQEDIDQMVQDGDESALKYRHAENAFYKKITTDPMLAEYGHKEFTFWNFLYHYFKGTIGYDYSIDDMQKFGLKNIVLLDETWEWRKHHPQHHVIRVKVDASDLVSRFPAN